jgi:3-mercaptopyruvate sulfurtransferase SseA
MRLFISKVAALGLCVCALLAACSPQDGSAPATAAGSSSARTTNGSAPAQATKQAPAQHDDNVRRITIEETRAAIEQGNVVVVDVRDDAAFKAGRIKGAKLIPVSQVEKRAGELPKDKLIITYCA